MTIDRALANGKLTRHRPDGYHVLLDVREVDALLVWRPTTADQVSA